MHPERTELHHCRRIQCSDGYTSDICTVTDTEVDEGPARSQVKTCLGCRNRGTCQQQVWHKPALSGTLDHSRSRIPCAGPLDLGIHLKACGVRGAWLKPPPETDSGNSKRTLAPEVLAEESYLPCSAPRSTRVDASEPGLPNPARSARESGHPLLQPL